MMKKIGLLGTGGFVFFFASHSSWSAPTVIDDFQQLSHERYKIENGVSVFTASYKGKEIFFASCEEEDCILNFDNFFIDKVEEAISQNMALTLDPDKPWEDERFLTLTKLHNGSAECLPSDQQEMLMKDVAELRQRMASISLKIELLEYLAKVKN